MTSERAAHIVSALWCLGLGGWIRLAPAGTSVNRNVFAVMAASGLLSIGIIVLNAWRPRP